MKRERKKAKKPLTKKQRRQEVLAYSVLLIPMLWLILFRYYPFAKSIISSFAITTPWGDFLAWAGLTNWTRAFTDPWFWQIIRNTFVYAILVLTITMFCSTVLALISVEQVKGSRIYQILYALPMVVSAAAISAVWRFVLRQEGGILNEILGTHISWLNDPKTAMLMVALITSWGLTGSSYMHLLVGFRNVSEELLEAATLEGASWFVKVRKIMLPIASPQIFYVLFLNILSSFKSVIYIKILTSGGPSSSTSTLMYSLYGKAMVNGQYEYSCVLAIMLFLVIFIVTRIQFVVEDKVVFYQ